MASEVDADYEGRKKIVKSALIRGMPIERIAEKVGLSIQEVQKIQVEHYAQFDRLDDHTMYLKQLERLEIVLDRMFAWLDQAQVSPDEMEAMLKVLKEISELAGLKTKKIQIEQKLVDEQRAEVLASFMNLAFASFEQKLTPLLTESKRKELTSKSATWQQEALMENAEVLEVKVVSEV